MAVGPGSRKALVVGAGIAGLATAHSLQRAGFAVEVLERSPALRIEGTVLSLWPNAVNALEALGLGRQLREIGRPQAGGAIRNRRGAVLSSFDSAAIVERFGAGVTMVERRALHRLLDEAASEAPIRLGAEVVGAHASPPGVRLADGSELPADLVVGADGLGSAVRASLFDPEPPRPSGLVAWRGVVEANGTLKSRLVAGECWGRGALFGMMPLPEGRVYWWAADREGAVPLGARDERETLLERAAEWPEPAEALVLRTDWDTIVATPLLVRRPLRSLVRGGVTLVGDAAHPMLPHLGQGACQALEDAAVLGACLEGTNDLDEALERYERRRLARTARVVKRSARVSKIAHLRGPLAAGRDLAMRMTPSAFALRQLDDVVGWRLESDAR